MVSWELELEDADKTAYHTAWGSKIWLQEGETLSPLHLLFLLLFLSCFRPASLVGSLLSFFYTDFSFKDDY